MKKFTLIFFFFTAVSALWAQSGSFVRIEGGTFTVSGYPIKGYGDEVQITVSSFLICRYEVTQKEYREIIGANPSYFKNDNLPVETVSWYDAVEYCNKRSEKEGLTPAYIIDKSRKDPNNIRDSDTVKWTVTWNRNANGYRLPTEAEWEYACRAGTTTKFWSGNDVLTLAGKANISDITFKEFHKDIEYWANIRDGYVYTSPVGSFQANPWGLYDMHGNVAEWCWDWPDNNYQGGETHVNPVGASSGYSRAIRGGDWQYSPGYVASEKRHFGDASHGEFSLGFRVVRNAQ